MSQKIDIPNDILPPGYPDPMSMSEDDLATAATEFATHGDKLAAGFLFGVLFSRVTSGVSIS